MAAAFTDTQFKMILSVSLILILLAAVMSTINCQKRRQQAYTESFVSASAAASTVSVISASMSSFVAGYLASSFPMTLFGISNSPDVSVQMPLDSVFTKHVSGTGATDVDVTKSPVLDLIACPESAGRYVADDTSHCHGVMQALHASEQYNCRVRVFDSYYKVRSLCVKVVGKDNRIVRTAATQMMYYLLPFAVHDGSKLSKVTGITIESSSPKSMAIQGGFSLPSGNAPKSVVVYYLDYVRPTEGFMQGVLNGAAAPVIKTYIGPATQTINVNGNSVTFADAAGLNVIQLAQVNPPSNPSDYKSDGYIPGLPNLAKLSVKFSNLPKAVSVTSRTVDISAESYGVKISSGCKTIPDECGLSGFANSMSSTAVPSNTCYSSADPGSAGANLPLTMR